MSRITVKPYKLGKIGGNQPRRASGVPPTRQFPVRPLSIRPVQEAMRELSEWPHPFPRPISVGALTTWEDKNGRIQEGTLPEYAIFWALEQVQAEFTFQSQQLGGAREQLGAVVDFVVYEPVPNLAIRVMGEYWHYQQGEGQIQSDYLQKVRLEAIGFLVIDIDGEDALRNPIYYVERAFEMIDLSHGMRERY